MAVDISVIIACRDHSVELQNCLNSLAAQETKLHFEVIVANSGRNDHLQKLTKEFAFVQLIESEKMLLPGAARNLGVEYAKADKICFIDADCVAKNNWVDEAFNALKNNFILAGGAVLDLYPFHLIASTDNRLQFVDFARQRPAGRSDYFPACNMAILKNIFEEAGKFREDLEAGEDVLLTTRIAEQWTRKVCFIPSMIVYHAGRTGLMDFLTHQKKFGYYRGLLGLKMSRNLRWLSTKPYLNWVVALRRLGYICLRVLQWDTLDMPRFILQFPVLLVGLVSWTKGYYEGIRESRD